MNQIRGMIPILPAACPALILGLALLVGGCVGDHESTVVVYTSMDQVHAEPVLNEFERNTGIRVRAVYDSEAVKTVGLANRLLAERDHPQCDVFWNNEELRTRQLAARGLFESWTPQTNCHRERRLVFNPQRVPAAQRPVSLADLALPAWRGKVALAYPLFGTTATHFLALKQLWGDARWEQWCRQLQSNAPLVVDGNSVVVQLVGRGEAWIGLTDSDDLAAGRREGWPLEAVELGPDGWSIPPTLALVKNAPHRGNAQELIAHLQRIEVRQSLAKSGAFELGSGNFTGGGGPRPIDWDKMLAEIEPVTATLRTLFLR